MTYSRPGTSEVNAFFRPATPNRLSGAPDLRVSLGSSGPLLDNRNAAVAGRNAGQGFAEVASFLDQFTKTAAPIYNAYADQQAKKQVGELFQTTDGQALLRSGDANTRQTLRALSPRAQELAYESLAQGAVASYGQALAVEVSNNQLLKNPQISFEDRSVSWIDIRMDISIWVVDRCRHRRIVLRIWHLVGVLVVVVIVDDVAACCMLAVFGFQTNCCRGSCRRCYHVWRNNLED